MYYSIDTTYVHTHEVRNYATPEVLALIRENHDRKMADRLTKEILKKCPIQELPTKKRMYPEEQDLRIEAIILDVKEMEALSVLLRNLRSCPLGLLSEVGKDIHKLLIKGDPLPQYHWLPQE